MVASTPENYNIPPSFEVIYQVPFKTMYHDPDQGLVITIWNGESEKMTDGDYKTDAENTVELIRDIDAHFMISDHRNNRFRISEELQKWYAGLIAQVLGNSGFEKCAVIITDDLNLLSALEEIRTNLLKLEGEGKIAYRFFNDFKEAEKWIAAGPHK